MSICIPAYRAAPYLAATMESVLSQTYEDWELVVVDNASPDATGDIARSFDDPRIRVHTNDRTVGLAENWNLAVASARGRYVKLLPADDLIRPTCVAEQVAILDAEPDLALVACRRDLIDRQGNIVLAGRGLHGLLGRHEPQSVVNRVARTGINPIGEPGAFLFRREDFFAVGGFDASLPYPLDLALVVRLLERGRFYGQSEVLASFRISSDSYTARVVHTQGVEHRILLRRLGRDPRWHIDRSTLWQGLALTHVAGVTRRLLYWSVASQLPLARRLPAIVVAGKVTPSRQERVSELI